MSQDTNVSNLIINKLTKAQYESISNPDPTQLYFITDEVISSSDVTTALGYTPYNGTTNPNGYISGITSTDVTTALGYTPYNGTTNPNGYISSASVATLTDVTLSNIADGQLLAYDSATSKWKNVSAPASAVWGNITGTLANQTDLNTALNGKQETLVSGTNIKTINGSSILGSGDIQLATSVDIDDLTITKNTNDELQTVATIDSNDSTKAIKIWTGTQAQYDVIATKDPNTLYNIKEDGNILKEYPARVVGQIIQSTIPLTDAGLHLLDGTLLNGSGIYSDFVTYIGTISSSYPNLFITESDWQSAVSTYGVCGKFVYDSTNNTVRLPKYNSKIYTGGGTAPVIGNGMTLGLTNGTQTMGLSYSGNVAYGLWGAINNYGSAIGSIPSGDPSTSKTVGITTDPTKSGIIAQLSDITTSLDGYYYIVIATSTKTDIEVDIDEIATDLNGKADTDLTNLTNGLANTICITTPTTTSSASSSTPAVVIENYINGTSWYRVYSDGWCEQGGVVASGTTYGTVYLTKTMANTNYSVLLQYEGEGTAANFTACNIVYGKTITSFNWNTYNFSAGDKLWYLCGYKA